MKSNDYTFLTPGMFVINEKKKDWGIGQIQSSINNRITINFENVGKKVINSSLICLEKLNENKEIKK